MTAVLGLLGIVLFIACIVGLAAAVTWTVVKVIPSKAQKAERSQPPTTS